MNAIIVIPTIRDLSFLEEWRAEFAPHKIIVCEDHPEKQVALPSGFEIDHYCWKDIDAELGESSWIIPHFNAREMLPQPCDDVVNDGFADKLRLGMPDLLGEIAKTNCLSFARE